MLHAANVLVHGEPVVGHLTVKGRGVDGAGVAIEVPARIHKGVHGVALAPRGFAALGASNFVELLDAGERRAAGQRDLHVFRQKHRKLILRHRQHSAGVAVNERNRRAPVTLAADAPILETEGDGGLAEAVLFGEGGHLPLRFFAAEAGERATIGNRGAFVGTEGQLRHLGRTIRFDDPADINAILLRELEVALVVRRDRHDGARAVVHQNVVAHPDGNLLAVVRVHRVVAGEESLLLHAANLAVLTRALLVGQHLVEACLPGDIAANQLLDQRMLRRKLNAGGSVDGVHAGGEDRDFRL